MDIDFQKVADAIEKSSPEIKDLIFSLELGDKVAIIAENNKLDEEVALNLFDEIGYVVLDLKPRSSFLDSLIQIGIDKGVAISITKEVESQVFSELYKIKNKVLEKEEVKPETGRSQTPQPKGVGQSFEQIILNQARAMQPAKPADGGIMNHESRIMGGKKEPPENLPTESEPIKVPNYSNGQDPYREPTE